MACAARHAPLVLMAPWLCVLCCACVSVQLALGNKNVKAMIVAYEFEMYKCKVEQTEDGGRVLTVAGSPLQEQAEYADKVQELNTQKLIKKRFDKKDLERLAEAGAIFD